MRTMIKCNYGENFRNLLFPCTESELQIFCDSLALPNEVGTKIRVGYVHDSPQIDALLVDKEVRLDELNFFMKRLDSFHEGEMNTFYAAASGQKLTSLKDMINLTFNTNCYSLTRYPAINGTTNFRSKLTPYRKIWGNANQGAVATWEKSTMPKGIQIK